MNFIGLFQDARLNNAQKRRLREASDSDEVETADAVPLLD
jgi:hypothetical protein